ncbi:MAG: FtsX-like permease family protein [Pirellulales bacterium]
MDPRLEIPLAPVPMQWLAPILIAVGLIVVSLFFGSIPLRYNVRNLVVRWRTTLMTALAFTMVIGLLTVMLAFVKGMYQLTESSGKADNLILLSAGVTDEAFSNLAFSDSGDIENQKGVARNEAGQPLCSKETYVVVNQPIPNAQPGRPQRRFVQVRGIEDPLISAAVHGVDLYAGGEWFSAAGVQAGEKTADGGETESVIEAVVGEGVAREFGRDPDVRNLPSVQKLKRLDTGDQIRMGGRTWRIVGVMKSAGSTFDSEVWALQSLVGPLFGKRTYTSIVLRADSVRAAKKLKTYFNDEFKKAALQAQLETEYFASLSKTNEQFLYAIVFIAAIMAVGGAFGITNTMLAAVSQRSKDIGVLRIIGYARWQVQLSFLLESLFIAILGGAIGCAIGYLADGWTATSIVGSGQGGGKSVVLKLVVDSDIVLKCMTLSVVMGLIGGLYPALSTLRLRPLEILR